MSIIFTVFVKVERTRRSLALENSRVMYLGSAAYSSLEGDESSAGRVEDAHVGYVQFGDALETLC